MCGEFHGTVGTSSDKVYLIALLFDISDLRFTTNIQLVLQLLTVIRHHTSLHVSYDFSAHTSQIHCNCKFDIPTILLTRISHRVIHYIGFQILTLHRACKSENP